MQSFYVDREYRTMLGTSFYDRVDELKELKKILEQSSYTTIVVYGPRE